LSDTEYEQAVRLGLKSYDEFERAVSPLLRRVLPKKRKRLLDRVYGVAARKIVSEALKRGIEDQARTVRRLRVAMGRTRAHIHNARKDLAAAQASLPNGLVGAPDFSEVTRKLHDCENDLKDREQFLASLVPPKLKTKTEKDTPIPEILMSVRLAPPFPWMDAKAVDRWFIPALDKCLGRPQRGRRSRFGRDNVIQKVLQVLGQPCSTKRIRAVRKLAKLKRNLEVQKI
jgi:hypothetical protein